MDFIVISFCIIMIFLNGMMFGRWLTKKEYTNDTKIGENIDNIT
jgi:hypothetical protein